MIDLGITVALLVPAAWLAWRSRGASLTGYFVFCAWVAGAAVLALFGLLHFLGALCALLLLAWCCRDGLAMKTWWTGRVRKP